MAFLEEQEWILFNEITYNVHYIYKVEDLLRALLDRLQADYSYSELDAFLVLKDILAKLYRRPEITD